MRKTTIFEVNGFHGSDCKTYFYPTSAKAHDKTREMRADDFESISITPKQITLNATGIAMAMQDVIDGFCLNE